MVRSCRHEYLTVHGCSQSLPSRVTLSLCMSRPGQTPALLSSSRWRSLAAQKHHKPSKGNASSRD
jgi:hypothetical protein